MTMTADNRDQRRFPRVTCLLQAHAVDRGVHVPVRLVNFSEGGALVETRALREEGETLEVVLHLAGVLRERAGVQWLHLNLEVLEELTVDSHGDLLYRYRCTSCVPATSQQRRRLATLVAAVQDGWAVPDDDELPAAA